MPPAIVQERAAEILQALVDADFDRLAACLAAAESTREEAMQTGSHHSESIETLAAAASEIQDLLERIERQQAENRKDLEASFKRLLRLTGRGNPAASASLLIQ